MIFKSDERPWKPNVEESEIVIEQAPEVAFTQRERRKEHAYPQINRLLVLTRPSLVSQIHLVPESTGRQTENQKTYTTTNELHRETAYTEGIKALS